MIFENYNHARYKIGKYISIHCLDGNWYLTIKELNINGILLCKSDVSSDTLARYINLKIASKRIILEEMSIEINEFT